MNLNLENKKAIVCGSTQGIGKAIAMELSALGAEIILIARSEEKLKTTLPSPTQNRGDADDSPTGILFPTRKIQTCRAEIA